MEFYTTTSTVRFPSGTKLGLNHKQSIPRTHLLKPDVDGMLIALETLEFKAGETIGLVSVPLALKAQLQLLEFDDEGDAEVFGIGWLGGEDTKDAESVEQQPTTSGDFAPVPEDQHQPASADLAPTNADACTDGLTAAQAVLVDKSASDTPAETLASGDFAPVPKDQEQPVSADLAPINTDAYTDGLTEARAVLVDKLASDTPAETVKPAKKTAK